MLGEAEKEHVVQHEVSRLMIRMFHSRWKCHNPQFQCIDEKSAHKPENICYPRDSVVI